MVSCCNRARPLSRAAIAPGRFKNRDPSDLLTSGGYGLAQVSLYILKQCGDNLTRDNVMYQATHMQNVEFPMLLPASK